MFDTDPTAWRFSTWWLYALALYYWVNFVGFWFRFRSAEQAARSGDADAMQRYNRMLRGFPNVVFAKQFGKRPLEPARQ